MQTHTYPRCQQKSVSQAPWLPARTLAFWEAPPSRSARPPPAHITPAVSRVPDAPTREEKQRTPTPVTSRAIWCERDNYARLPGLSRCPPPTPSPPPPIPLVLVIASGPEVRREGRAAQLAGGSCCGARPFASRSGEKLAAGVRGRLPRPSVGWGGDSDTSGLAASPLLLVGGGSLWNTPAATGRPNSLYIWKYK